MNIGKIGVWAYINHLSATVCAAFAQRLEQRGYGALWLPEAFGRDPLLAASWVFANTRKLNVATGIANIYARDSLAMVSAQYALAEQSGGRFLLGIGVSHIPFVEGVRGHQYEKPIPTMKRYLEAMAHANYIGAAPAEKPKTVLAALGPKMLELAATHADGAHPYNVTPEHTAKARQKYSARENCCVRNRWCCLEKNASTARAIARGVLSRPGPTQLPQQFSAHGLHVRGHRQWRV